MSDSGSTSKKSEGRNLPSMYLSTVRVLISTSESMTCDHVEFDHPISKGLVNWNRLLRKSNERTAELWGEFIWSNIAEIIADDFDQKLKSGEYQVGLLSKDKTRKSSTLSKAEQAAAETVLYLSDIYNIGSDDPKLAQEFMMNLYRVFYLCAPLLYSEKISKQMLKYEQLCQQTSIMLSSASDQQAQSSPLDALRNINLPSLMAQGFEAIKDKVPEQFRQQIEQTVKNNEGHTNLSFGELIQKATDRPEVKQFLGGAAEIVGNFFNGSNENALEKEIHDE